MRLRYIILINVFLAILFSPKINAQCTLPEGSYQWGFSDLDNYIFNNCGDVPLNIIIPNNTSISLRNNDPWDLTSYGAITLTIEGKGRVNFNGNDKITMVSGGQLVINETTNSSAINLSGNLNKDRLAIGSYIYTGHDFPDIIAAGGAPFLFALPIELTQFYSYTTERNEVQLIWETASEINNQYFEIEHSLNGIDFEMIGRVEGNGTTNFNQKYNFVHLNPSVGNNYYRLKQMDYDLSFEYFDAISQVVKDDRAFQVKVNSLNLLSLELNQSAQMIVYDMAGRVVFENKIAEGTSDLRFENLAQGSYVVQVFNSIISEQVRISR